MEKDIGVAQTKQDDLDRKAQKAKEEAEKKINVQARFDFSDLMASVYHR